MPASPLSSLVKTLDKKIKSKPKVCPTFTPASIKALDKYTAIKGFLHNTETVRWLVNAILIKEGLLNPSDAEIN